MAKTRSGVRQFFPKGKDLSIYTPADLARAEKLLNSRPRKILNWRTPDLVFAKDYSESVRMLRGPDEFTLELTRRKGVNFSAAVECAVRRCVFERGCETSSADPVAAGR